MNGGKCCIGGITTSGRYVRLLTHDGENQPEATQLTPRQIWEIKFKERREPKPPHIEDVLIQTQELKTTLNDGIRILDYINDREIPIWSGHPNKLFDEKIKWTEKGSGFINEEAVPVHSVGFWISDRNLTKRVYYEKVRYDYRSFAELKSLPYVGFEDPIEIIPSGSLIRVSLARWWDTKGTTELRCPLQLSGWYD